MIETDERMEVLAEPPALPGRWTICAMLFVATTINYMDRQVLSILKPVLAQSTLHLQPFFGDGGGATTSEQVEDVHAALRPNSLSNKPLRSLGMFIGTSSPLSLRAASR